jgi:hypothetical protein
MRNLKEMATQIEVAVAVEETGFDPASGCQ